MKETDLDKDKQSLDKDKGHERKDEEKSKRLTKMNSSKKKKER